MSTDYLGRITAIIGLIIAILFFITIISVSYSSFKNLINCEEKGYDSYLPNKDTERGYIYCCKHNYVEHIKVRECKAIRKVGR